MSRVIKNIFALALLGFAIFVFRDTLLRTFDQIYVRYFPCQKPIVYTLGSFDEDFGISEEEFLGAIKDAEKIWEEEWGSELFTYAPASERALKVNLIYDHRQEATNQIEGIRGEVDQTRASYDKLRAEYNELQKEYLSKKGAYQNDITLFQQRQKKYNDEVKYWNEKGGAPEGKYKELNKEEEALRAEYQDIKAQEAELNKYVPEINSLVATINDLARKLNIDVATLNTIGEMRGDEFTQGEYKSSHGGEEINIYEFSTKDKLIRVLAHEFGHALGLLHVEDEEAIMYRLNENKTGKLSEGDKQALNSLCSK